MNSRREGSRPSSARTVLAIALIALASGFAACGSSGDNSGSDGGDDGAASGGSKTLIVALRSNPVNLDPHTTTVSEDTNITNQIYNTLVGTNESLEPVPELATEWEISDDGLTYTFQLAEGVEFHDGTPFDADAVVFNFERVMSDEITSPQKEYLSPVKSVKADGPSTVVITLKQPSASFLGVLSTQVGQIVSPTAVEESGEDYGAHPVGTGPFKFVEWVADSRVIVEKNESYFEDGLPKIDGIRFDIIPDGAVALTAVRTGDADISLEVPEEQRELLDSEDGVSVVEGDGLRTDVMLFNSAKPPFDNVNLRRAINYAIDRQALVEGSLGGLGTPAYGMLTPSEWAYDESLKCFPHDVQAAKRELQEGGQSGTFKFKASVTSVPENLQSAEAIQAQLAEAGIEMEIVPVELTQAGEMLANGDFQAARLWSAGRVDPGIVYSDFYVSQEVRLAGDWKQQIFDLIAEGDQATDRDERIRIYRELQNVMCDQGVDTFIYHPKITAAVRDRVTDFQLPPDEHLRLKDVGLGE
jgi:peptide/nickel transport system substrate-binding protein